MGDQRKGGIAWTEQTWNPIRGCSRVSEGCRFCYAEEMAARFCGEGQPYEGLATRNPARWTGEVRLIAKHLADPVRWKRPRMIFVNSMSDLFHEKLSNEQIAAVYGMMVAAPWHVFQVLTKRPERRREWHRWLSEQDKDPREVLARAARQALVGASDADIEAFLNRGEWTWGPHRVWPAANIWEGVSVEDQRTADERIPILLDTPAALRWISAEPLLGLLSVDRWVRPRWGALTARNTRPLESECLDWVVVGGESGPHARVCEIVWIRSIMRECAEGAVPCFTKQLGYRAQDAVNGIAGRGLVVPADAADLVSTRLRCPAGKDWDEWPEDLRVRQWPEAARAHA